MRISLLILLFSVLPKMNGQRAITISGKLIDAQSNKLFENVSVSIEGSSFSTMTDSKGEFIIIAELSGEQLLVCTFNDYVPKRIPVYFGGSNIDLGVISLEPDLTVDQTDNLITLTDTDLSDDVGIVSNAVALLQATRDVFLNRAAFDFGQAFFRVRGYDSREGKVLINGLPMNKLFDGRPQWNNWGGLNDVVRNQTYTNGLEAADLTFGGILGNTNIDTRPSGLRPGIRLSASASNRTYTSRLMATYTSPLQKRVAYSFSASRRWAKEGYIDGTLYDAYSFFGALEYRPSGTHALMLTAILAKNRRGRSPAVTEEVFELAGNRYNPYWGIQNGDIRNARERDIFEPIIMLNHYFQSGGLTLTSGIAYQFGAQSRSRLGYFNAPNPDPTYYRYLPSFYINNPIGADFTNAALAKEGFLENLQLNWNNLYLANSNTVNAEKAAYVLYDDVVKNVRFMANSVANLQLGDYFKVDAGINLHNLFSENYAELDDLLGASFHEDIDPFSDTLNDVNGEMNKVQGDIFSYHYEIDATTLNGFVQLRTNINKWEAFLSTALSNTSYQRIGLFQNERFLESSFGKGEKIHFLDYALKGGVSYQFSGRHWLRTHAAYLTRPPVLQSTFVNPRESNEIVADIQSETVSSVDLNYFLRLPDLTGRVTGFYTRFQNTTDINFFFVDSGVGSDFVQEVITDLDKLNMGIELGLAYEVSSNVTLSLVASMGKYLYANNPSVTINFDTAGQEEPIDQEGNIDLGFADIKDYRLAQGPQRAMAFGIEYRDPEYWWAGATANHLANNYEQISTITRTPSFLLDPETGQRFVDATEENVTKLLAQEPLDDFYLLNLVGGKSWLINDKYISIFASVNNLFDTVFRTGGYEQSRNGNFGQLQQDNLRDNPTFAPKYWYGFGRTYFLNVAVSF
ncbi:TonB-dependent receptor [Allomuricauda sp. SCSIO 65647]|uniref:TonB-dependent receptor n=1 Tax=Allomuricauda sp. SCSIO 65647 TaxID=2908843 RepID=UPI001F387A4B|nr:TonB-dependent receptor [Muricauda sp. SCSIO 65647]UJH66080.1 TonB-dependent receptor [Muricauda sp. SCSIO 65647]